MERDMKYIIILTISLIILNICCLKPTQPKSQEDYINALINCSHLKTMEQRDTCRFNLNK